MPDTGAPWNIPYVAGTDLVSDWPTDSQTLAEAIADGLDAAGNAGIGTNVVHTIKTDSFSASTAGSGTAVITGLSASITPTSASSKVLVLVDVAGATSGGTGVGIGLILKRAGTAIGIGDAASNRSRGTTGGGNTSTFEYGNMGIAHLDSPATTSSTTYTVEIFNGANTTETLYVNRPDTDTDASYVWRTASRITLIEVAA